jgi:hypothetical protein
MEFINDIRCISHVINLVAQDILKDYLLSNSTEDLLFIYTNLDIV